jgi:hypothetical protein
MVDGNKITSVDIIWRVLNLAIRQFHASAACFGIFSSYSSN